jgi:hypothetical protein
MAVYGHTCPVAPWLLLSMPMMLCHFNLFFPSLIAFVHAVHEAFI